MSWNLHTALLACFCGVWALVLIGTVLGRVPLPLLALPGVPVGLGALALVLGGRSAAATLRAAAFTGVTAAAVLSASFVPRQPLIALVGPVVIATALLCAKRPALVVVAVFALTGSYGSLTAFTSIPVGESVDVLLAALWLAVLWGYLFHGRDRPLWVWPGIAATVLYLALTAFEILTAESLSSGLQSFRVSTWYMLAFLLVALGPWRPETRLRIVQGVVVVALVVGAYACVRLIVGASDQEITSAVSSSENDVRASNLGLLGSFPSKKRLAAWCAVSIPFSLGFALLASARWRIIALAACAVCTVALFGTGARFAAVAMVLGVAVIVVLYQLARAFPGLHFGTTVAVVAAMLGIGTAGFLLTQGDSDEGVQRYGEIFSPSEAKTYQKRVSRWGDALEEMGNNPAGTGLGTVGRVQKASGTIETIGLQPNLDSSYLKVGLEQGPVIMVLFIASLLLLFTGMATRVITTTDRVRAALGIGACGTLAALFVLFFGGFFSEGLPALAGWLMVGIGVSQFTGRDPRATAAHMNGEPAYTSRALLPSHPSPAAPIAER